MIPICTSNIVIIDERHIFFNHLLNRIYKLTYVKKFKYLPELSDFPEKMYKVLMEED